MIGMSIKRISVLNLCHVLKPFVKSTPELQLNQALNKANTSDTEAPFLDLHLSISNGFVSSKIHDKRDDFELDIVNFPFLDGDVPRSTSYGDTFLNLFGLLECLVMLLFSMPVIKI